MDNAVLRRSKANPADEFYTMRSTVEREMAYHRGRFRDKRVYCNCDDPNRSQFAAYFHNNFKSLGLRELVCTSWVEGGHGKAQRVFLHDGHIVCEDWSLDGDGSFDSTECVNLLDACDVVVTNPPFSKAGDYLAVLFDSGKDFCILGSQTWLTRKCMFDPIVSGKVRIGRSITSGSVLFEVPDSYFVEEGKLHLVDGRRCVGVNPVRWYTTFVGDTVCAPLRLHTISHNLSKNTKLRRKLHDAWGASSYVKYDNCDAIDVPMVSGIPCDYDGLMGVPVNFLLQHNPAQFDLVRIRKGDDGRDLRIHGKNLFTRVLIRNRKFADAHC